MKSSNGHSEEKRGRVRLILRVAIIALAVALLIGSLSWALAKYASSWTDERAVAPEGFHLRSDYLTDGAPNSYNVYNDVIEFRLMNHDGIKITDQLISYSVMVLESANDVTSSLSISDSGSGALTGGTQSENTITISGLTQGKSYTVLVRTNAAAGGSTYLTSLSANYSLLSAGGSTVYEVLGHGDYLELVIYTGQARSLTIKYDGLAPDNASALTADWLSSEGAAGRTLSVSANSTYHIIFFGAAFDRPQQTVSGEIDISV